MKYALIKVQNEASQKASALQGPFHLLAGPAGAEFLD